MKIVLIIVALGVALLLGTGWVLSSSVRLEQERRATALCQDALVRRQQAEQALAALTRNSRIEAYSAARDALYRAEQDVKQLCR